MAMNRPHQAKQSVVFVASRDLAGVRKGLAKKEGSVVQRAAAALWAFASLCDTLRCGLVQTWLEYNDATRNNHP